MENTKKKSHEHLADEHMEKTSGGGKITYLICCTCGSQIPINGPMINGYYNNNICPKCGGRLKSW